MLQIRKYKCGKPAGQDSCSALRGSGMSWRWKCQRQPQLLMQVWANWKSIEVRLIWSLHILMPWVTVCAILICETNQYYLQAINPAMKFEWYHKHEPAKMQGTNHHTTQSDRSWTYGGTSNAQICSVKGQELGMGKSVELSELEALAAEEQLVPEDIMAFVASLDAGDESE